MNKFFAASLFMITLICFAGFIISWESEKIKTKAGLGRKLFNEKMLSKDSTISCASCHIPAFAFADTIAFSMGIGGKPSSRNTPSVLNMKNRPYYFWDGRALSLHEQALIPLQNPDEMGLPVSEAVKRLTLSPEYNRLFRKIFGELPNEKNLAMAFSAFEQTLETVDSKFDYWSNDKGRLSEEEERGRLLFTGSKAKCFNCHFMEDFTDDSFRNIGLFNETEFRDAGRFVITKDSADRGKFKTPGLRNVAVTAPYMHNGMFQTLEQVLAYYNAPGHFIDNAINIDSTLMKPLGLSPKEKKDIIAFLKTLTDKAYVRR
ncbi:MAG: cytochrome c peroxidase [Ferruginibacter sp.]